jgi:hypothetical protein
VVADFQSAGRLKIGGHQPGNAWGERETPNERRSMPLQEVRRG